MSCYHTLLAVTRCFAGDIQKVLRYIPAALYAYRNDSDCLYASGFYLLDSNLDRGQDLPSLKALLFDLSTPQAQKALRHAVDILQKMQNPEEKTE